MLLFARGFRGEIRFAPSRAQIKRDGQKTAFLLLKMLGFATHFSVFWFEGEGHGTMVEMLLVMHNWFLAINCVSTSENLSFKEQLV